MLQGIQMARIVEAIGRCKSGAQDCVEAACLLGMSERHFRRLRDAYAEGGLLARSQSDRKCLFEIESLAPQRRRPHRRSPHQTRWSKHHGIYERGLPKLRQPRWLSGLIHIMWNLV